MHEIVVKAPDNTPAVFLTGNLPELGQWRADAIRLDRWGDGTFRTQIEFAENAEFLLTCGYWRSAEVDDADQEISPRKLAEFQSESRTDFSRIDIKVPGWGRGAVDYHQEFKSKFLTHPRSIIVYKPPGYNSNDDQRYPVLYMNDGQNIFDSETSFTGVAWGCGETAERVTRCQQAKPVIIVGISNTPDRNREYAPREHSSKKGPYADLSRRYGRCLVEEVKPFVDAQYRTLADPGQTGIGGSSLGGLISLHLSQWYPDVFGLCAALSPSLWFDHEYFLRTLNASPGWLEQVKIWLDVGGNEGFTKNVQVNTAKRVRRLASILKMHGRVEGKDFQYLEVPEGTHHESAWAARFDHVMKFLFARENSENAVS